MFEYQKFPNRVTLTRFHGKGLSPIAIPETIERLPVTAIDSMAFFSRGKELTSISIPAALTDIPEGTFASCSSLASVTVSAENPIFSACSGILFRDGGKTLFTYPAANESSCRTIPRTVTRLAEGAFANARELREITIPETVQSLGRSVFYGCRNLEKAELPDSLTVLPPSAFSYCESLREVQLPAKLTALCDGAFWSCGNLQNLTLPDTLRFIGGGAFHECFSLRSISLPASVRFIEPPAFADCRSLRSIEVSDENPFFVSRSGLLFGERGRTLLCFPAGCEIPCFTAPSECTKLARYAFCGNPHLRRVTFSEGLSVLPEELFRDCVGLEEVCLPSTLREIGEGAFRRCRNLKRLTLPDGLRVIGDSAFSACESLSSLRLPPSIRSLGEDVFSFCRPDVLANG